MNKAMSRRRFLLFSTVLTGLLVCSGCRGLDLGWWNWFDPSRPVRAPEQATVNLIFDQIGPADQTDELVPNATLPTPEDLVYGEQDYVIGPTDFLRITVLDLFQEGLETPLDRQVTYSGYIQLPFDVRVKASGLTAEQLTDALKAGYVRASVLKEPVISVTVVAPRQNTFSMLGAVERAGTYNLIRKDFTLLEALALAGDVNQPNIDWVYVIRPRKKVPVAAPPEKLPPLPTLPTKEAEPKTDLEKQLEDLEESIPSSVGPAGGADERVLLSSLGGAGSSGGEAVPPDLGEAAPTHDWIYSAGRWIRVPRTPTKPTEGLQPTRPEVKPGTVEDPFNWKQYDMSELARIIAVDLRRLKNGDPSVNIIIRENDIVHVPPLQIGEFYMMGEVARPGPYSLTGRRVTVKQALAAASGLGVLSWPDNCVLIRRIGRDQEQIVKLPLDDIIAGRENDIYLKPDDVIAVGSHWAATFLAVWRNAFRMTYGFGFIYDRNYSERDFEVPIFYPRPGFRPYQSD